MTVVWCCLVYQVQWILAALLVMLRDPTILFMSIDDFFSFFLSFFLTPSYLIFKVQLSELLKLGRPKLGIAHQGIATITFKKSGGRKDNGLMRAWEGHQTQPCGTCIHDHQELAILVILGPPKSSDLEKRTHRLSGHFTLAPLDCGDLALI